jgi:hypothetical protein
VNPRDVIAKELDETSPHGLIDGGRRKASDIIDALTAAGFVIVPFEPTKDQLEPDGDALAYFDHHRKDDAGAIYREMIARRPT